MHVPDTLARTLHSGNACMNECPSVPHDSEQGEEEKTGDRGSTERGAEQFFFNSNGDEAGPFGPYVPICGPFPRAVRFDVVFFKAVFTKRAPIPPFFRPQKWLRRSNMVVPSFLLSLSFPLLHVFPPFFHWDERHCAFSGAFQSQTNPLWRLAVGRSSSSINARASFDL